jgi:hypothetical protein
VTITEAHDGQPLRRMASMRMRWPAHPVATAILIAVAALVVAPLVSLIGYAL